MEGPLLARCPDPFVARVDQAYQRYWRRIFWEDRSREEAGEALLAELGEETGPGNLDERIGRMDERLKKEMGERGWHYLGGRTSGHYGPYIWKTTEAETHRVELPQGTQDYRVYMLDGFVSCSWLEYVSLGVLSPGGWQEGEGQMFCVASAYPRELRDGPRFQISLLKHEAQHAWDAVHHPGLSSVMLEYRAKLVELCYYPDESLLLEFIAEADPEKRENAHGCAAHLIVTELSKRIFAKEFVRESSEWTGKIREIQTNSREIFGKSIEKEDQPL